MLSTLIYRSRLSAPLPLEEFDRLLDAARQRNAALGVTGILLFDGVHFVQLLEGREAEVTALYDSIRRDKRHCNVVQLLRDYAPTRRFEGDEMAVLDLRDSRPDEVLSAVLGKMTKSPSRDDRVVNILHVYAKARWTDHIVEGDDARDWQFTTAGTQASSPGPLLPGQPCQFALQPIVEPLRRKVTSYELLIRSDTGGSPDDYFASVPHEERYVADLQSKAVAFDTAKQLGIQSTKLSVNLFPMSLITVPDAVDCLLAQIANSGLSPRQVIVEVTEQEAISCLDTFGASITQLRKAGIGVAIDDFGAGFAGLSLLAEFQPDKLKIDRKLIQGIHTDGPRQAIVRAILQACAAMGITPVAEGVEEVEEWCWLQAAGVERFQGYLFARPALNRVPEIHWPQRQAPAP